MIARIVTGSGRTRRTFALPCSTNRKEHVEARLAVGNTIKSKYLFRNGKGFAAAKARGVAALAVSA